MKKNKITYIITTIILFSVLILFDCSCDVEVEKKESKKSTENIETRIINSNYYSNIYTNNLVYVYHHYYIEGTNYFYIENEISNHVRFSNLKTNFYDTNINTDVITSVSYYANGQVSNGTLIQNVTINNINYFGIAYDIIRFYENGKIKQGHLTTNTTIHDIIYKEGSPISYYENSKVKQGRLAESTTIEETVYPADRYIRFNDNGKYNSDGLGFLNNF